jgi:hypothetical protein
VPAAHDGAELALSAALDGAVPTTITATIHAPAVTVQLSCGDTCNLAAGDPVGIEVTAPALIRPAQAFVDTRLDGVPQLVAAPLALTPGTTGFATGTLAVHAPAQPGTWQIDVTVAGYAAPALVTTCH